MAAFTPVINPLPTIGGELGPDTATLVTVAAGTLATATASQEWVNQGEIEGIEVLIDFTKVGAAPSVVPSVEGWDSTSKKWFTMLTGAAIVANGKAQLLVSHHAPNVTNVSAAHVILPRMRITMTHGNTDTATYSISVVGL